MADTKDTQTQQPTLPLATLTQDLHHALRSILSHPSPALSNPPECRKRASVALILRIRPHPVHWPDPGSSDDTNTVDTGQSTEANTVDTTSSNDANNVNIFFQQDWVQHGDPEILFIKRAARAGDRWTSHVALPGGKRDPGDADDQATAVRETWEEVGLDLRRFGWLVGKLPDRVVTTSWGTVPLMVLCPFVYLLRGHDPPPLRLQGTEVSSAHWVPLRALLSSSTRTVHQCDISDRLAGKKHAVTRWIIRATLGKMVFAGVRLVPSQSVYDTFTPEFLSEDTPPTGTSKTISSELSGHQKTLSMNGSSRWLKTAKAIPDQPLVLWGLTLGIVADFVDLLPPPHEGLHVWFYPTFTAPDVRFWLAILSRRYRKHKEQQMLSRRVQEVNEDGVPGSTLAVAVEKGLDAVRSIDDKEEQKTGPSQLGSTRPRPASPLSSWSGLVGFMLDGYWDLVRRTVFVALVTRFLLAVVGGGMAARWILWTWASRRRRRS